MLCFLNNSNVLCKQIQNVNIQYFKKPKLVIRINFSKVKTEQINFEAGKPVRNRNSEPQPNFPGSYIKKVFICYGKCDKSHLSTPKHSVAVSQCH